MAQARPCLSRLGVPGFGNHSATLLVKDICPFWQYWRWHLVPSSSSRDAPHRARRPRRSRVRASAVHRTCAHGFKATALTDNERERGQSGHASQHGVPSGEAQFRLPAHRVRSITCPHAPSTCGRLAVNAEIELESAIADSASFAKASGRTSR